MTMDQTKWFFIGYAVGTIACIISICWGRCMRGNNTELVTQGMITQEPEVIVES